MLILLKIFLIAWVITHFKPLQIILELLPDKLLFNLIRLLFSCFMCTSFWTSFVFTLDPIIICLSAFTAFWYDKIFGFYEKRIRLN